MEDTTLGQRPANFSAGDYVVLDVTTASLDPEVFGADADRFDPHRVPRHKVKPVGLAFGEGPHTCIGAAMSMGEVVRAAPGPDDPVGLVPFTLRELFRAGVTQTSSRGRPAELRQRQGRVHFVPVRFATARGLAAAGKS